MLPVLEAQELVADLRHGAEARNMQLAYARLGSTLSLDDLLRGVEALDAAGVPLEGDKAMQVREILTQARQDHADIVRVQAEIIDTEAKLGAKVDAILQRLPPDVKARVSR